MRHSRWTRELTRCRTQLERLSRWLNLVYNPAERRELYKTLELWQAYQDLILSRGGLEIHKIISTTARWMDQHESAKLPSMAQNSPKRKIMYEIYKDCSAMDLSSRRSSYCYRVVMEFAYAAQHHWFCAFSTLTCTDYFYPRVFGTEHKEYWNMYLRTVRQAIARALGITYKELYNDTKRYHRYIAVTEFGHDTGRLHIHVVHFAKCLPMAGRWTVNYDRMCDEYSLPEMSAPWSYGIAYTTAIRTSDRDAFSHFIRWPRRVDESTQRVGKEPADQATAMQVARYITKYLTKEKTSSKLLNKWRTKATKNLGCYAIKEFLETLTVDQLYLFVTSAQPIRLQTNQADLLIPKKLIIYLAEKEWMSRKNPDQILFQRRMSMSERVDRANERTAVKYHNQMSSERIDPTALNALADYDQLVARFRRIHYQYLDQSPLERALIRGGDR